MSTTTAPYTKPQPVLIAQAILAGAAFIFGGLTTMAAATDNTVLAWAGGLGTLIVGGANITVGFIVRGQVVPLTDVAAFKNEDGDLVAGPEATEPTGELVQQPRPLIGVTTRTTTPVPFDGLPIPQSSDTKADAAGAVTSQTTMAYDPRWDGFEDGSQR